MLPSLGVPQAYEMDKCRFTVGLRNRVLSSMGGIKPVLILCQVIRGMGRREDRTQV